MREWVILFWWVIAIGSYTAAWWFGTGPATDTIAMCGVNILAMHVLDYHREHNDV